MTKRHSSTYACEYYFADDLPVFINRSVESFQLEIHSHDFYEISLVSEGAGFHYLEDECMPVSKGDVFLLPIGVSHVFRPASAGKDRKLVVYNCLFSEELTERFQRLLPHAGSGISWISSLTEARRWIHRKDERGEFERMIAALHEAFKARKPGFHAFLLGGVLQLIGMLHPQGSGGEHPPIGKQSPGKPLELLFPYIELRLHEPISLTEAAKAAGLSERHLSRLIRDRTGMSYIEYLQQLRVREACRLLRDTPMKVSDIADRVGYRDIKFFGRLFRIKTGLSPREYRKERAEAPANE